MNDELKPCPLCGGAAHAIEGDGPFYGRVQIDCSVCRNATYWWEEAVAVRLWNARALLADGGKGEAVAPIDCGAFYAHDMDRRLAKLSTALQAECAPREAQPDGWKLVPIEPTQAMIYAAADTGCCMRPTDTYAAMLDAAPTPERADALYTMDQMRDYAQAFHKSRLERIRPRSLRYGNSHIAPRDVIEAMARHLPRADADTAGAKPEPTRWQKAQMAFGGGASQERADAKPCTCHPDDNPPKPCAQKYALNECRADAGKDAARYQWMRRTFISDDESWPDEVAFAKTAEQLDSAIDAILAANKEPK